MRDASPCFTIEFDSVADKPGTARDNSSSSRLRSPIVLRGDFFGFNNIIISHAARQLYSWKMETAPMVKTVL